MANTYTQIYIHIVFSVKHRQSLIEPHFKDELLKYITGIIQDEGLKLLAINSMPDHIHIFIGLDNNIAISNLVRKIKINSSKLVNSKGLSPNKFYWQKGYGAFSYSKSHKKRVINYILNQEKHHQNKSFKEEYIKLLDRFNIKYDEKYLFDID